MPNDQEVESSGAVRGCDCNPCTEQRQAAPVQSDWGVTEVAEEFELTECARCNALTDTWTQCSCRPCPHCETLYNMTTARMCDPCFVARVQCPVCGLSNLSEDTLNCRCGVENLCRSCQQARHSDCNNAVKIRNYSYKPPPKFTGEGPLFLGVELEVDTGRKREGRTHEWARNPSGILDKIGELSDDNKLFYLKGDASLGNGFEIVTHPCSLDYHRQEFPCEELLEAVKEIGLQSHNTNTCGLHVHASRLGFGNSDKMQEKVLGRLMMLWGRHWWRYAQMSRRRTKELGKWCMPNREAVDVAEEDLVEMIESVKKPGSRSVAINTQTWEGGEKATAEFRLFKGTLQHSSLMAALEIVHHSITISQSWKFNKIATSKWVDVVKDADDRGYKYLTAYVVERGVE